MNTQSGTGSGPSAAGSTEHRAAGLTGEAECLLCGRGPVCRRTVPAFIGPYILPLAECPRCGLAFQSPMPTQEQGTEYFNWRYRTSQTGRSVADQSIGHRDKALAFARARAAWVAAQAPGRRLLDVGAGNGAFVFAAREAGFEAEGIDLSPEAIALAASLFGVEVARHSIDNLPADRQYDVITLYDTIEHLRDPAVTLRGIGRHLRSGGMIVLETPNYQSLSRLLQGARWYFYLFDHIFYFAKPTLQALLERTGFGEVQLHEVPRASDLTRRENFAAGRGPLARGLLKLRHAWEHPVRTLRQPFVQARARRLWPDWWQRDLLLMTARKR